VNGWELVSQQLGRISDRDLSDGLSFLVLTLFVWVVLSPLRHKPRHVHRHIYEALRDLEAERDDDRREIRAEEDTRPTVLSSAVRNVSVRSPFATDTHDAEGNPR
jgi:hypothetical protein